MKYKVLKTSPLGRKLMELQGEMNEVGSIADKLVKELGGKKYCRNRHALYGGISAIEFNEKPSGWITIGKKWQGLYMPNAKQKAIWEKINSLPLIKHESLNSILKFNKQSYCSHGRMYYVNCPGVLFRKLCILIEVNEELKYKPVPGMKEITVSEFNKLSKGK